MTKTQTGKVFGNGVIQPFKNSHNASTTCSMRNPIYSNIKNAHARSARLVEHKRLGMSLDSAWRDVRASAFNRRSDNATLL